jgi:hypothetical protein
MDGENYNDGLSATVVVADVTGDGLQDMMITADGYDSAEGILYIYPGAATDLDGDGYASAQDDGSGVYATYDCNDREASLYPTTWYLDADGDGEGAAASTTISCGQAVGYVSNANDCDDSSASVTTSATETCDSIDNNCDGTIDEGVTTTYYLDSDSDGYGSTTTISACSAPSGYVTNSTDCDDSLPTASPTGTETCGDSIDQNCDGSDLSCSSVDADGDSLSEDDGDCDDTNATIYPFATETCGDSIDQDCDGSDTTCAASDGDGDTYTTDTDCNDSDASIYPSATEIADDGIDQDCDGVDTTTTSTTTDDDGDGYDTTTDCDDTNDTVYPGALELGDGLDNDCDDRFDERLLTGSITSVPTSVDAGASFDVEYELTNDTGITDFRVELLINNYSNFNIYSTAASWGIVPSKAMYICTSSRCTTMDDSTVTLPMGLTTTATTTVIMPATVTSGETYTVRIRVTDDATGQYFVRDLDRVAIN